MGRFLLMARSSELAVDALQALAFSFCKIVFKLAAKVGECRPEALYRSSHVECGGASVGECPSSGTVDRTIKSQDRFYFRLDAQFARRGLQPFHPSVKIQYVGNDQPRAHRTLYRNAVVTGEAEDEDRAHRVDQFVHQFGRDQG